MASVVGIDVGGTFTDLVLSTDGVTADAVLKVPSTPDDPSRGLVAALEAAEVDFGELEAILHGTTIATNAVIERKGARCALITTQGFRDVLELGRRDRPQLYGLAGVQKPLIERDLRWEVPERITNEGVVMVPLDEDRVEEVARGLLELDVEAVAVAFLHAYANPAHEQRAREILREVNPDWAIAISSDVLREHYEFERTSTTVVQAYLEPLVTRYAKGISEKLSARGYDRGVLVMQSNGGVTPVERLAERAAHLIRSGPSAGVVAAAELAADAGFRRIITGDMGGTSFDVAVVIDGEPEVAETTLLDFRIPLRLPMADVHTIGAGGGSIAWIDRGGVLQVGPQSAGSVPGPISFRRGGTQPTVTDANLLLGRINAQHPIGGGDLDTLDVEGCRAALEELGAPLGLDAEETAEAVLEVVNTHMAGRMRLISVEQGHDPRDFALVAFGGAGPLHGAALMRHVGVPTMLVPRYPGVLCAQGCLLADVRYDYSQTVERRVDQLELRELRKLLTEQRLRGEAEIAKGGAVDRIDADYYADMAYLGQVHRLRVKIDPEWEVEQLQQAFLTAYESEFGATLGDVPTVLVNARTAVKGVRVGGRSGTSAPAAGGSPEPRGERQVRFAGTWYATPVYERNDLAPGHKFTGPAIVEQDDSTTVIEPEMVARVDAHENIRIEVGS